MATETSTPGDRPQTRATPSCPIVPATLWPALTPVQQQHVRETLAAVCREWLITMNPREVTHDE
jgi:hypothetical protein